MRKTPTILLTGFGAFPGVDHNASGRYVKALATIAARRLNPARCVADVLPTEWNAAPDRLRQLYQTHAPDIVLHFGVSAHASGFVLEQVATNRCDACLDAGNELPDRHHIVADAPQHLSSTFPATAIADRLQTQNIPSVLSEDAGTYLCNAVLFQSLFDLTHRASIDAAEKAIIGFIHLPQDLGTEKSKLSWRNALSGGLDIIEVCRSTRAAR